jgi:hypothetical protein
MVVIEFQVHAFILMQRLCSEGKAGWLVRVSCTFL